MPNHTLTQQSIMPVEKFFKCEGPIGYFSIGSVNADNIGDSLSFYSLNEDNSLHLIRRIADLTELDNNSFRIFGYEGMMLGVGCNGASVNLYVEFHAVVNEANGRAS